MPYRQVIRSEGDAIKKFGRRFNSVDDAVKHDLANLLPALLDQLGNPVRYKRTHHVDAIFLGWNHHGIPDGATTEVVEIIGYGTIEFARYDDDDRGSAT